MGWMDWLSFGSDEKMIRKHAKRIKTKDAQQEDRQASAIWLADQGSPEAIVGLLGRFEMTYEHHMKDANEKAEVEELVLALGVDAVRPLRSHLPRCKNFARPLALFQRLTSQEEALELVISMVEREAGSELKPERKRHLLIKLAEFVAPEAQATAISFLADFDEGVRYAAAEVLIAQPDSDEVREALVTALANLQEESTRFRGRLAEIAAARRWTLGDHEQALKANSPTGYETRGGRLVKG